MPRAAPSLPQFKRTMSGPSLRFLERQPSSSPPVDQIQDTLERDRFVRSTRRCIGCARARGRHGPVHRRGELAVPDSARVTRSVYGALTRTLARTKSGTAESVKTEVTAIGFATRWSAAETHPGTDTEADGLVKTVLPTCST